MPYAIRVGGAQVIGDREEQQDAFAIALKDDPEFVRHGGVLAVVADGVGGHAHGAGASKLAVQEFLKDYLSKPISLSIPDALHHALQSANRSVCQFAEAHGHSKNCGTTLVAAVFVPETGVLYWINIGDSRLYLLRDKQWVQLTSDCNYANHLVRKIAKGVLTITEVDPDSNFQALTSYLGLRKIDELERGYRPLAIENGDWLVLCTDGIYNTLEVAEMVGCLTGDPQDACGSLMQSVTAKGAKNQDNATVAILSVGAEDPPGSDWSEAAVSPKPPPEKPLPSAGDGKPTCVGRGNGGTLRFGLVAVTVLAILIGIILVGIGHAGKGPEIGRLPANVRKIEYQQGNRTSNNQAESENRRKER